MVHWFNHQLILLIFFWLEWLHRRNLTRTPNMAIFEAGDTCSKLPSFLLLYLFVKFRGSKFLFPFLKVGGLCNHQKIGVYFGFKQNSRQSRGGFLRFFGLRYQHLYICEKYHCCRQSGSIYFSQVFFARTFGMLKNQLHPRNLTWNLKITH